MEFKITQLEQAIQQRQTPELRYIGFRTPIDEIRESSDWLENQNVSILGNKYTKNFTVKSQSGKELL